MNPIILFFPTLFWLLGYVEFLLQLSFHGTGDKTLALGFWLSLAILIFSVYKNKKLISGDVTSIKQIFLQSPLLFKILCGLTLGIFVIGLKESLLPPHLAQESDAITYHMGLVRQHLLQGNLRFLDWSAADLWPLTISYGFAPIWFFLSSFNKIPQFISALWLFFLLCRLGWSVMPKSFWAFVPALAFISTHGVMVQMGTAMMDLSILYFLIAGIVAWQEKKIFWAALHFSVFTSAKAFSPGQTVLIILFGMALTFGFTGKWIINDFLKQKKLIFLVLIFSLILLSRSMIIDLKETGTPFFPFFTCKILNPPGCQGDRGVIIQESSKGMNEVRVQYGFDHGVKSFVKHLWRISVPTDRVNNEYDYPLGWSWLLGLIFLGFAMVHSFRKKQAPLFMVLALSFWAVWWMGSHQARWLYPVIAFSWLAGLPHFKHLSQKVILGTLVLAAGFSLGAQWRALRGTLFRSPSQIIEEQKAMVQWQEGGSQEQNVLKTIPLLYVDKAVKDHTPGWRLWILR